MSIIPRRSPWFPLALALVLAGCAKAPPPPAAVYPYKADAARVFYATSSGLSELTYQGEADAETLASRAPNASVLSADGKAIAVAVNGWGVERIEASPDGRSYRIVDSPLRSAFAGLSTGGAWPMGGGFLVQLYRDPFAESAEGVAAPPSSSRLAFFGADGKAATAPDPYPTGDAGYEPFALLPASGKWFAELRKDAAERVDMKFYAFADPLSLEPRAAEIRRAEFEAALMPRPLSSLAGDAGAALRSALGAMGKGPWLVRLRSLSGDDLWYLSAGSAEESNKVFAWSTGDRVAVLSPDGRLALSDSLGPGTLSSIAAPAEGASFTALAASGRMAAAAWETGSFPYISSAGIVLSPLE